MPSYSDEMLYELLLKRFREQGFLNPESALEVSIREVMLKGRTREEAIRELSSSDSPWTYSPEARTSVDLKGRRQEKNAVLEQISDLRGKIHSLTSMFSKGEISEETYRRAVNKIEEDVSRLQREHGILVTRSLERATTDASSYSAEEMQEIVRSSDIPRFENQNDSRLQLLRKYFIHGIAFSLLFLVLGFMWSVVLVLLAGFGFLIGLAIGFGLLFFLIGYANSVITRELWFDVKMEFWELFAHGLVLFFLLLPIDSLFLALRWVFPDLPVLIVTFLLETIPQGYVASKVAGLFRD